MTNDTIRDPESTKSRILDAALNVFASKGYYDTRMDEIVDESHTSKGAIYFHFPNKERLFLALVDQFADLLERRVTEAIEPEEKGIARVRVALETGEFLGVGEILDDGRVAPRRLIVTGG